ncbi:hypothetical protein HYQ46_012848 [Verticillium longisporum]|nr:hypothetical protein HYQ46_012848 [Verticillium longisporum]
MLRFYREVTAEQRRRSQDNRTFHSRKMAPIVTSHSWGIVIRFCISSSLERQMARQNSATGKQPALKRHLGGLFLKNNRFRFLENFHRASPRQDDRGDLTIASQEANSARANACLAAGSVCRLSILFADERSEWFVFFRALRFNFGEREDLRYAFAVRFDEIWRVGNHLIEEEAEFAGRSVDGSAFCFHPSLNG